MPAVTSALVFAEPSTELPDGTSVVILCAVMGETVASPVTGAASSLLNATAEGGCIPDVLIDTGTDQPTMPQLRRLNAQHRTRVRRGAAPVAHERPARVADLYVVLVHAAPDAVPARRRPPVAALLAAPLAVLSALAVAFFGVLALAFSNGQLDNWAWLFVAVPAVLALWLLVGALLLLLGRSWLALFLPAAGLALVVIWGILDGTLGDGTGAFLILVWVLPGITALLAVLPGVRRWIAARRYARLARD